MRATTQRGIGIILLLFNFFSPAFADSTFVKFGASWKYLDNATRPAANWKDGTFNDDTWSSGLSAFGYNNGYRRTTIKRGITANLNVTAYFRKSVNITRPSNFDFFRINIYLNDGAAIYINGKEVGRPYMNAGIIEFGSWATPNNVDHGNVLTSLKISSAAFKEGLNDIAIEVHQNYSQTQTMIFDMELVGVSGKHAPEVIRGPLLQMLTTEGVIIKWKTNLPASSTILYGLSEGALTGSVSDKALVTDHELIIKGLKSDTKYFYAIGTNDYVMKGSYRNSFITAPLASSTRKIRIGVIGDAGTGNSIQKRSRDRYLATFGNGESPDLALMLGDNAYPLGIDKDYQAGFFDIYNDNLFNNHPVFSVPGNHEYGTSPHNKDLAYFNIFSMPTNGESGGLRSGTESYYSFNYGNIHFVMLNSYGYDGGKIIWDTLGQQTTWLKNDLAANAGKSKWTIACFHHPPYTNGNHSSDLEPDLQLIRERITPILERYNVDLVLSGHSHSYERSYLVRNHTGKSSSFNNAKPPIGNMVNNSSARYDGTTNSCPYILIDSGSAHGTVYVVAGASGQLAGGVNAKFPVEYYRAYYGTPNAESGIFTLEIEDNRLDGKYIGASTGAILDHFTMMKGAGKRTVLAKEVNTAVPLNASWMGSYTWASPDGNIANNSKSISVNPSAPGSSTYLVRDNVNEALSCITDTFVVRSFAAVLSTNVQFTATKHQNSVTVKWTTEQEINTDYYAIERSANGTDYTQIGTLPGPDLSALAKDYTFEDKFPITGKNYYRLIRVVKTGSRTELGVRIINFIASYSVSVTPFKNPSPAGRVEIVIQNERKQMLSLKIVDLSGAAVYTREWTIDEGTQTITLKLRPGSYIISGKTTDGAIPSVRLIVR